MTLAVIEEERVRSAQRDEQQVLIAIAINVRKGTAGRMTAPPPRPRSLRLRQML